MPAREHIAVPGAPGPIVMLMRQGGALSGPRPPRRLARRVVGYRDQGTAPETRGRRCRGGPGRVRFPGAEREGTRPAIGYVPQTVLLDPDLPLRARDVVALGVDGHRLGIALSPAARRQRRARVEEMLAAVDARRFADARVGALSGGEQQRVLIAHALVARPRLLLLDEPLANLDLRAEQEVVELLGRIAREQGVSVLLSAHDINPLLSVMARLIYVAGGRAASGTTAEVVRSDVLSTLYGHHVDVLRVHERVIVVAGPHGQAGQVRGAEHGGAEAGISSL